MLATRSSSGPASQGSGGGTRIVGGGVVRGEGFAGCGRFLAGRGDFALRWHGADLRGGGDDQGAVGAFAVYGFADCGFANCGFGGRGSGAQGFSRRDFGSGHWGGCYHRSLAPQPAGAAGRSGGRRGGTGWPCSERAWGGHRLTRDRLTRDRLAGHWLAGHWLAGPPRARHEVAHAARARAEHQKNQQPPQHARRAGQQGAEGDQHLPGGPQGRERRRAQQQHAQNEEQHSRHATRIGEILRRAGPLAGLLCWRHGFTSFCLGFGGGWPLGASPAPVAGRSVLAAADSSGRRTRRHRCGVALPARAGPSGRRPRRAAVHLTARPGRLDGGGWEESEPAASPPHLLAPTMLGLMAPFASFRLCQRCVLLRGGTVFSGDVSGGAGAREGRA